MNLSAAAAIVLALAVVAAQQHGQSRPFLRKGNVAGANADENASYLDIIFELDFSGIKHAGTDDAPTVSMNTTREVYELGAMNCDEENCDVNTSLAVPHSISVLSFEVKATGGNAMMIDSAHATMKYHGDFLPLLEASWGIPNDQYGWCLSTDADDFSNTKYRNGTSCLSEITYFTSTGLKMA